MPREIDGIEVHLVASEAARTTAAYEFDGPFEDLTALADVCHDDAALDAPIASGTFETGGMIVVPCSIRRQPALRAVIPTASFCALRMSLSRRGAAWCWSLARRL